MGDSKINSALLVLLWLAATTVVVAHVVTFACNGTYCPADHVLASPLQRVLLRCLSPKVGEVAHHLICRQESCPNIYALSFICGIAEWAFLALTGWVYAKNLVKIPYTRWAARIVVFLIGITIASFAVDAYLVERIPMDFVLLNRMVKTSLVNTWLNAAKVAANALRQAREQATNVAARYGAEL